jgi:dienelactone hydrolase
MTIRQIFLAGLLLFTCCTEAQARLITRTLEYRQDGTVCKCYLAYDDAFAGQRPGVLVVHEWWGLNDFARTKAGQLAGLGYVALAADIYGKGASTTDPQQAAQWAGEMKNSPQLLRARAGAALKALAGVAQADPQRLAAIGFCFGGTTVLELAYAGAPLAGVVSFHGGLTVPRPEDYKQIKTKFLVLHGADDPHVPPKDVAAFEEAMRQAGTDWVLVSYGGAVHTFTNPAAGSNKASGVAYDAKAARRSWRCMQDFLKEIFRKGVD